MRPPLIPVAVGLLCCAALAGVASLIGAYAIDHNAFWTCTGMPAPAGALPYEPGYAGSGSGLFPVAGTRCDWHAADGGVFSTFTPQPPATAAVWSTALFGVGGLVVLGLAVSRARTPRRE